MKEITTTVGGIYHKEFSAKYRKAQVGKFNQVMATKELKPLKGPIIVFGLRDMCPLQTHRIDALVIKLKIAPALVQ